MPENTRLMGSVDQTDLKFVEHEATAVVRYGTTKANWTTKALGRLAGPAERHIRRT